MSAADVTFLLCRWSKDHLGPASNHTERLCHAQILLLTKKNFNPSRCETWKFLSKNFFYPSWHGTWNWVGVTLIHSKVVFCQKSLPQSIWDLERTSLSAIIKMMSSVATLKWKVLIGQCFIFGIVSSVGVLKMRASDWTVLWTMHHLFIPFYSTHSEVVPVVLF